MAHDSSLQPSGAVLESGPAATDRNYWLFVVVLCVGMAGWFVYDGAVGYMSKNRAEAKRSLAQVMEGAPIPELSDRPTDEDFRALLRNLIRAGGGTPATGTDESRLLRAMHESARAIPIEEIQKHPAFAKPLHRKTDATGAVVEYYASAFGMAIFHLRNGLVDWQSSGWRRWGKTPEEVRAQYYWALIPVAFGAYALLRLVRAATLRVVIDERGMTYAGRLIPWDTMVSLRDFSPKGWVDLYHRVGGGVEQKLRLDNQRVKRFDEIIEAICGWKGFENPVKAHAAAKARESAAE